ncbi:hypothetical protein DFQ27_005563 [Actinomortierella ambigua]|uniref:Pre-rRNA-processing protein RIX1 n=1 Tax=Actinomortierella ambigua TaxID=1343610 RepID=A0A9P6UDE6_9FUNG|nr:hypothetical protein DFQ27_005563 [Actinomortierella ambigua]
MSHVILASPANLLHTLLRNYLRDDATVKDHVPLVLETISHYKLLQDKNTNDQHKIWAQRLRSLLESQQTGARWAGACFVRITMQQSHALFADHVRTWATLLVGILSRPESTTTVEATISTLIDLFERTAKRPDLQSDITSKFLQDFHRHLLTHIGKKELLPTIFRAFTSSFIHFPTTSRGRSKGGPISEIKEFKTGHKDADAKTIDNIEKLCIAYLDGRFEHEPELVKAAATCLASVHFTNSSKPEERAEFWRSNVQDIIKLMHLCLNGLYTTVEDKVDETQLTVKNSNYSNMSALAKDPAQQYPLLTGRFTSLATGLAAFLTCATPYPVAIPMKSILTLLARVYDVSSKRAMSDSHGLDRDDYFTLMVLVPALHLAANKMLKTLIAVAEDHLVPHMSVLARISTQGLRHNASSRMLRASTYDLIEACIRAFGYPYIKRLQDPLMAALLDDLRMPSSRVLNPLELGAASSSTAGQAGHRQQNNWRQKGGASGGKHNKGGRSQDGATAAAGATQEDIVSPQVFAAALSVLSVVFTTAGPNLAAATRASADTLLVTHLLNSQHQANPIEQVDYPFYTPVIRASLYRLLVASLSAPGDTLSSLLSLSVGIFKTGLMDPECHVRDVCSLALTTCDLLMHSRLPPMQRARTIQKKGDKAVQDPAMAVFGGFEAPGAVKAEPTEEEDEEEEEEEEEEEMEDDTPTQEQAEVDGEDVDMEESIAAVAPQVSMTAFKAAASVSKADDISSTDKFNNTSSTVSTTVATKTVLSEQTSTATFATTVTTTTSLAAAATEATAASSSKSEPTTVEPSVATRLVQEAQHAHGINKDDDDDSDDAMPEIDMGEGESDEDDDE